jgi:aryl-alcohol dehydrogenase-like predicted oxidoreductase
LKKANKVVEFGVSIYENTDADQLLKDKNIDVVQLPFNLLDNLNQRQQVIKALKQSGKKIHSRSAFLQGLFMMELSKLPFEELKPCIKEVHDISLRFNIPIESLALQYCLSQDLIENTLIGVDNLIQLKKNISIEREKFINATFHDINNIKVINSIFLNPSKWMTR